MSLSIGPVPLSGVSGTQLIASVAPRALAAVTAVPEPYVPSAPTSRASVSSRPLARAGGDPLPTPTNTSP